MSIRYPSNQPLFPNPLHEMISILINRTHSSHINFINVINDNGVNFFRLCFRFIFRKNIQINRKQYKQRIIKNTDRLGRKVLEQLVVEHVEAIRRRKTKLTVHGWKLPANNAGTAVAYPNIEPQEVRSISRC